VIVTAFVTPPYAPEIVTAVLEDGLPVETVNVALVLPAVTVTDDGTDAALVLLLDSMTTAPPDGAGAVNVTVPVPRSPPRIVVGLTEIAASPLTGAVVMVKVPLCDEPLPVAVIVALVLAFTDCVLTEKLAELAPGGTVTLAGTTALRLLLDRLMTVPPFGAVPLNVTVPIVPIPPCTVDGFKVTEDGTMGGAACPIVSVAVAVPPPRPTIRLRGRQRSRESPRGRCRRRAKLPFRQPELRCSVLQAPARKPPRQQGPESA
jgi:hypothetical protein